MSILQLVPQSRALSLLADLAKAYISFIFVDDAWKSIHMAKVNTLDASLLISQPSQLTITFRFHKLAQPHNHNRNNAGCLHYLLRRSRQD